MEGTYDVLVSGRPVGQVHVTRQGLYYRFRCCCQLPEEGVCKLRIVCNGKEENLGVLVPTGCGFGLETKVPVKRLGEGKPSFRVVPNRARLSENFIPIYPEEPFSYIERLKDAYLVRKNGQLGLAIREKAGI